MSNYEYEGETFKLDNSKGCYVEVTYKDLIGYFGVNIRGTGTDQYPYSYYVGGEEYVGDDEEHATPAGLTWGDRSPSPEDARDQTCGLLLETFRDQEEVKNFNPAKYCKELNDAVKNQP